MEYYLSKNGLNTVYANGRPVFRVEYDASSNVIILTSVSASGAEKWIKLVCPRSFLLKEIVDIFYKCGDNANCSYLEKTYFIFKG